MEVRGLPKGGGRQVEVAGGYLGAEAGERGEDAGVDEAELGLDLVAAQVVDRLAALVQNQVLGVGPEPKMDGHTVGMVSFWGHSCPRSGHVLGVLKRVSDLSRGHPEWPDTAQVLLKSPVQGLRDTRNSSRAGDSGTRGSTGMREGKEEGDGCQHSDPEVQGTRGTSGREVTTRPVQPQPPGPEVGGGRAGRCPIWIKLLKRDCYFILHVSYFRNTHMIINTGRVCPEVRVWRVQAGSQPQASGHVPAAPPRGDSLHGTNAPSLQGGQEPRGPHTSPSTAGICCPGARAPGPCGPPGPRGRRPSLGNWEEASGGSAGAREAQSADLERGGGSRAQLSRAMSVLTSRPEGSPHLLKAVFSHSGWMNPSSGHSTTMKAIPGSGGVHISSGRICQVPGVTTCSQGSPLGERPHLRPSLH